MDGIKRASITPGTALQTLPLDPDHLPNPGRAARPREPARSIVPEVEACTGLADAVRLVEAPIETGPADAPRAIEKLALAVGVLRQAIGPRVCQRLVVVVELAHLAVGP